MSKVGVINETAHPLRTGSRTGVITLERHGTAGVKAAHRHPDTLLADGHEVELVLRDCHTVSGLPPRQRGMLSVVSEKTAMAAPERDDLVVAALLKKDRNGRILYCGGLARLRAWAGSGQQAEKRD